MNAAPAALVGSAFWPNQRDQRVKTIELVAVTKRQHTKPFLAESETKYDRWMEMNYLLQDTVLACRLVFRMFY
jgi:hypothetical protein